MLKQLNNLQKEQGRNKVQESHALEQIDRATRDRALKRNALSVYIAIISAHRCGVQVLNRDQLNEVTGIHVRVITKAIRNLKDQGYIKAKQVKGGQEFILLK